MENVWDMIGQDPLFIAYSQLAQSKNLPEPSSLAHTGKVLAKLGRYTMISHCYVDSMLLVLADMPKTSWQILRYLERSITGIGRNRAGDPKIYITYRVTEFIKKANIKGLQSFYKEMKRLEDRRIIFFRGNNLYLNIFPLTWNLEDELSAKVRDIVNKELERIERNGGTN